MPRTEKAPAYQCYAGDQLADVAGLSLEQVGIYQLLAWQAWREEGLPSDPRELAKRVGLPLKRFEKVSAAVLRFFSSRGDRLVLQWQEQQRADQKDWREKSRAGGLKSAERRKALAKGGSGVVEPNGNTALCSLQPILAITPSTPPAPREKRGGDSSNAEAFEIFKNLRQQRIEERTPSGVRHRIPSGVLADLSPRARYAVEIVGGAHEIAQAEGDGLRVLRSQFATAYLGAPL